VSKEVFTALLIGREKTLYANPDGEKKLTKVNDETTKTPLRKTDHYDENNGNL